MVCIASTVLPPPRPHAVAPAQMQFLLLMLITIIIAMMQCSEIECSYKPYRCEDYAYSPLYIPLEMDVFPYNLLSTPRRRLCSRYLVLPFLVEWLGFRIHPNIGNCSAEALWFSAQQEPNHFVSTRSKRHYHACSKLCELKCLKWTE